MELTIKILYCSWIFGAIIMSYFSMAHLFLKEYSASIGLVLAAAFPLTAFIAAVVCFAGLVRYTIYLRPKSFKQLVYDIKMELMIDCIIDEFNAKKLRKEDSRKK